MLGGLSCLLGTWDVVVGLELGYLKNANKVRSPSGFISDIVAEPWRPAWSVY